eukprot:gene26871-4479_t
MNRLVAHLRERLKAQVVISESPTAFVNQLQSAVQIDAKTLSAVQIDVKTPEVGHSCLLALGWFVNQLQSAVQIDAKTLRFCYDRLSSLMKTLEITNTEEFHGIHLVADFATLVGTYAKGFAIIIEPFDARLPHIPDPVIQLSCLDASLAMKPIFAKFQSVVITSGTLSPIDLYPSMTLSRDCICPVVVTRGADQVPVTTAYDMRDDPSVVRNYGRLLVDLASIVPDGMVAFFVSYLYMDQIIR